MKKKPSLFNPTAMTIWKATIYRDNNGKLNVIFKDGMSRKLSFIERIGLSCGLLFAFKDR